MVKKVPTNKVAKRTVKKVTPKNIAPKLTKSMLSTGSIMANFPPAPKKKVTAADSKNAFIKFTKKAKKAKKAK
jgi:hypothetical protein